MKKKLDGFKIRRKYNRKQALIICAIAIYIFSLLYVFARYVTQNTESFFNKSKEFYFYSDKLDINSPNYQIENWSGIDNYTITINMNNSENNLLHAEYDIQYNVTYSCSSNIICQVSKVNGIISGDTNTDSFNVTISPNTQLTTGDRAFVQITATTNYPYQKTISGSFTFIVGQENMYYEIVDAQNSPYLELNITNTLSYYLVQEAFDDYQVGEKITIDTYSSLSEDKKNKCYSAIATLRFNPDDVILDMTNSNYIYALQTTTTQRNSYNYINSITFKIEAISSVKIRFYKKDITQNYTYPIINNNSIVQVTNI